MAQPLAHPFPLRLTPEERANLDHVREIYNARPASGIPGRTTHADVARMALKLGLQTLLQNMEAQAMAASGTPDNLPDDAVWMNGGAQAAAELLPVFDWGSMDPTQAGDPILVVARQGAFVVK